MKPPVKRTIHPANGGKRGTTAIDVLAEFMLEVIDGLSGRLTFRENMRCTIATVRLSTASLPLDIRAFFTEPIAGVQVWAATAVQSDGTTQSGNRVTWQRHALGTEQYARVSAIDDLTAGVLYDVTFHLVGG